MKASTKRMFSIFLSAIFIIAALVIFVNFVKPVYKTITDKRSEVASRGKDLASIQTAIEQSKNNFADYRSLSDFQKSISLSLPQDQSLASAIYQFSSLALTSGLTVESINISELPFTPPSGEENALLKGTGTINLNIKATGSYESLKNFLDKLETNIRIFDLDSLKIDQIGEKSSDAFNFNIGVNTYYISN